MIKKYIIPLLLFCCISKVLAYDFKLNNIYYNIISTNEVETTCMGNNCYSGTIYIPSSVNYNNKIYTVSTIGNMTFQACDNLSLVVIPESITSINTLAFEQCTSLKFIKIPNSVTYIGDNAFGGCSKLDSISISSENPCYNYINDVIFTKDTTTLIQCMSTKSGNYELPHSVVKINKNAFEFCSKLTSITLPERITNIEEHAFTFCSNLESINIPQDMTQLNDYTFSFCTKLRSINIPEKITSIGSYVFSYCGSLNSIYNYSKSPVDLKNSLYVFNYVDKTSCKLYVPKGSKTMYQISDQWKEFSSIIEMNTASELTEDIRINIYPNPANKFIYFEGLPEDNQLTICDLTGKVFYSQRISNNVRIETYNWPNGIYIALIISNDQTTKRKFTKLN